MGVTRDYATREVAIFNKYFSDLPEDKKQLFYNGKASSLEAYETCLVCGNSYSNFRKAVERDCPTGCTISPIIHFSDTTNEQS
jgi:hypothetical protein